ncbi:fibrous sheath-interacting protein 2-like isoform X2 [Sardina pilchardus]|uniref:fibrous sheath-interacting protein 2-like isoform X2 n=1 Tax=Sardina pilchardus TaxID=27697 RepID=UPI002E12F762
MCPGTGKLLGHRAVSRSTIPPASVKGGSLINSEYNSLHDPYLRGYLYRKDIHRRLIKGGFITKDDKVICSLRSLNRYREHVADVEKVWGYSFRAEQKEVVRTFLTLQEQGRISSDVTVADVTDWIWRSMPDLRLQHLPAIAKRCSAIEVSPGSTGRSELMWSARGIRMREEITREVQREMRLERRWVVSKINKEKKREEQIQRKLKKVKKTVKPKSKKEYQERLLSEDPHLLPEETENGIGGQGEPSQSLDVSPSLPASPKVPSPSGDVTTKLCERVNSGVSRTASPQKSPCLHSPPQADLDLIFPLTPNDIVRSSQQNSPERNISLVKQHPFSDAKKKLSEICQKLIIKPSTSACGIIRGRMPSAEQISSCLLDIQQTLLENHFKGMVTSEELQLVLRGIAVTLLEEVNDILIPAIIAFEYERVLPANSPRDLSSCYDTSSTTSKISPVSSSSLGSAPEVHVTYPNYMLPTSRGASRVELWSASSPEDGQNDDRRSLRKKVVAPTAGLLLKVENLIKDIITDSVDVFTTETGQVNGTATVSIAECAEGKITKSDAKIQETKSEDKREMEVSAERCCTVSPETTDSTTAVTTEAIPVVTTKSDAEIQETKPEDKSEMEVCAETPETTDSTTAVTINTTTDVTIADVIATTDKTAVVTMNTTTTLATMDTTTTAVITDVTAGLTMETNTTAVTTDATAVAVAMDTTFVDHDFSSNHHLVEQSSDNIRKDSAQQLEANDAMSDHPEFSGSEASHEDSTSSDASSGFVVSLERSILLSSDQVDEILEKVRFALEEERPSSWLHSEPSSPEDGHKERHKDAEMASPPPNSVIFAIIQKMQLDKYLQRKLMSFFAGRQMTSPGSPSMSPMAVSSHPGAQESLSWNSFSEINPHSIKVTKWLLQTIQRRNSWQDSMTSEVQEMDGQQFREKHLICEVIQALLDHLNDVSSTRSLSRQTQSESDVRAGVTAKVHVDAVVSDTSLAASELTKDVVAKLLLEDNSP